MTKKFILPLVVIVAVVAFGVIGWVKSESFPGKYQITNWYGNIVEDKAPVTPVGGEGQLGISEFFNGVTFNQLAPNVLQEKIVRLSPAQVASISDVAVELLAAPGSGFTYDIEKIIGYRKFASESFVFRDTGTEGFEIKFADSADITSPVVWKNVLIAVTKKPKNNVAIIIFLNLFIIFVVKLSSIDTLFLLNLV